MCSPPPPPLPSQVTVRPYIVSATIHLCGCFAAQANAVSVSRQKRASSSDHNGVCEATSRSSGIESSATLVFSPRKNSHANNHGSNTNHSVFDIAQRLSSWLSDGLSALTRSTSCDPGLHAEADSSSTFGSRRRLLEPLVAP